MDVKAAIDANDVATIEQILASDPQQANALVRWVDSREHLTHPLHYVCDRVFGQTLSSSHAVALVRALLAAGSDVNYGNGDPLNAAASLGAVEVAFLLLEAGARTDLLGPGGETALHWAAYIGAEELVRRLLAAGSPIEVKDENYDGTPLGWALYGWSESPVPGDQGHHPEVVLRLARAGAQVEPAWLDLKQVRSNRAVFQALGGKAS